MKSRTLHALYAYWNDVRRGRIAPRRFEIEPSRIASILPETFILERVFATTYRYRLAGTRICEDLGCELRGTDFLARWGQADRVALEDDLSAMTNQGAACFFTLEAEAHDGGLVDFEILLLPLVHSPDTIDRFVGAMAAIDPPAWLGSANLDKWRLSSHELIWPDGRPHSIVERANRQVPFLPQIRTARIVRQDRRQFRVYDGGLAKPDGDER